MSHDDLLKSLLGYHQRLVSDEFVRSVMKKVDLFYKRRQWILSLSTLMGVMFACIGIAMVWPFDGVPMPMVMGVPYMIETIAVVLMASLITWVFQDELSGG
jgi:membrane glycosyltransferase